MSLYSQPQETGNLAAGHVGVHPICLVYLKSLKHGLQLCQFFSGRSKQIFLGLQQFKSAIDSKRLNKPEGKLVARDMSGHRLHRPVCSLSHASNRIKGTISYTTRPQRGGVKYMGNIAKLHKKLVHSVAACRLCMA